MKKIATPIFIKIAIPILKKFAFAIYHVLLIVILLLFVYHRLSKERILINSGIQFSKPSSNVISTNKDVITVMAPANFEIIDPSLQFKLLSPEDNIIFDPLYLLYFCVIIIIIYIGTYNLSYEQPFTPRFLKTFYAIIAFTTLFFLCNFLRYQWFDKEVLMLTDGKYGFTKSVFNAAEFWILLVLFRIVPFISKGVALQEKGEIRKR